MEAEQTARGGAELHPAGPPFDEFAKAAVEKLNSQYPAQSYALNRELSQLLVFLEAPDVVEKTLGVLANTKEPAEQIWFAYVLREAKGWTPEQRGKYFAWFNQAREYQGGNSFAKFILRIRDQALAKLTDAERTNLLASLEAPAAPKPAPAPAAPRDFVKAWTMDELTPELDKVGSARNFARGKELYVATQCAQCHQFGTQRGGNVGPDITAGQQPLQPARPARIDHRSLEGDLRAVRELHSHPEGRRSGHGPDRGGE
jgi:mono/diheme cytochrome c family protein